MALKNFNDKPYFIKFGNIGSVESISKILHNLCLRLLLHWDILAQILQSKVYGFLYK